MDNQLKTKLGTLFTGEEMAKIEAFLDRGFSQNGQIVIVSIFLFAREHGKSIAEVLQECGKEWERNWQYQHPDIKGDADAPGGAGIQNRVSLESIYSALKIPSPLNKKKAEIPTKAVTVITQNSTYRFGEANEKGERTISRDGKPLDFTRCKIISLVVDEEMELECLDGPHPGWHSSSVLSIE